MSNKLKIYYMRFIQHEHYPPTQGFKKRCALNDTQANEYRLNGTELFDELGDIIPYGSFSTVLYNLKPNMYPENPTWVRSYDSITDDPVWILLAPDEETPMMELQISYIHHILNIIVCPKFHDLEMIWPWIIYPNTQDRLKYSGTLLYHFHECQVPNPLILNDICTLEYNSRLLYIQEQINNIFQVLNTMYPFPKDLLEFIKYTICEDIIQDEELTYKDCTVHTNTGPLMHTFLNHYK